MGKRIEINEMFELMLISAVRYAIGRRTYIVQDTVTYVCALSHYLSNWCLDILLRDLVEAFEKGNLGDNCDWQDWTRCVQVLAKERDKRAEEKE